MWTVQNLLKKTTSFLAEKKIPESRLEAEILLAHVLGMDRIGLYTHFDRPVTDDELDPYRDLIMARARGKPTAYLIGKREFFSLSFKVTPSVLIPRPETEDLVQTALDCIPGAGEDLWIADLGTGSGCISITLLTLRARLNACATDISPDALAVAEENAVAHKVSDRIRFYCGDLLEPLSAPEPTRRFHLIACNPPYIDPEGAWPAAREVKEHEPPQALFTPEGDPAYYYRKVLDAALPFLERNGFLLFELGVDLLGKVEESAADRGWRLAEIRNDLAGIERVAAFQPAQ